MGFLAGIFGSLGTTLTGIWPKAVAVLIAVILILDVVGYFYYKTTQTTIANLNKSVGTLEASVGQQQATIKALQDNAVLQSQSINDLESKLNDANTTERNILGKINSLNINQIAQTDNNAATTILNNNINNLFNDITSDTKPTPPTGKASQ